MKPKLNLFLAILMIALVIGLSSAHVMAGSVVAELLFIALGAVLLWERKRYEKLIRESEQKYQTLVADRKETEARHRNLADTLQAQISFLQTLVDTIPNPIFYKDRGGRYLGCNQAFENYLGLAKEQIVGMTVYDIAPHDLAQKYFEMDQALFHNAGPQLYESCVQYADGTRHNVIFNKATFADVAGDVAGLAGVMLDVTERKKAEDLLAEREEFLSCIIDSIQDGISILDAELRIVRVNPVTQRRFSDKMLLGRKCHEAYHGRSEPCPRCSGLETLQSGIPSRRVFSKVVKGAEVWLEINIFPLFDPKKTRVTGLIEYIRDVTDGKRAEEALRESEERFHQIFAQNFDAIILFRTDDLRIIDANPRAAELTGFSRDELMSFTPAAIIDPVAFCNVKDSIRADAYAHWFRLEKGVCQRKDGSTLCVSIWSKIIMLRDRFVVYCSIRDITEKTRLIEEIRTTQAKLIHANKMASLGLLASSVAHEINNPNNCISVNASMLTDVWRDAEPLLQRLRDEHGEFDLRGLPFARMRDIAPQLFNGIVESSRRISAIVDNMKDCVREDKSGLHGTVAINKVVRSASSILWHHIYTHTDNFQLILPDDLPAARGNSQQIEQVIINLVVNALQALTDKHAGVFLATCFDKTAGEIVVTVRDEGGGINKEDLKRLREPFFTTRQGGTGLGLYISSAIIKEHSGTLEIASEPGQGTTVEIRIPALLKNPDPQLW